MQIAQKYSHLNGEEYLIVHHQGLYAEIQEVIASIDAEHYRTKISKEIRKKGNALLSPIDLNKAFHTEFHQRGWSESRYNYYITLYYEGEVYNVMRQGRNSPPVPLLILGIEP
jgi:hypothetical protein